MQLLVQIIIVRWKKFLTMFLFIWEKYYSYSLYRIFNFLMRALGETQKTFE